jgi:hypothetical protein
MNSSGRDRSGRRVGSCQQGHHLFFDRPCTASHLLTNDHLDQAVQLEAACLPPG